MTEASERALIERAQGGDRAAFEELLRLHYDAIFRMAFKWCGNRADAQDIAQGVCIKLARALASFQFRSAFLTWLYPLVINTAKDWARSRARHDAEELNPEHGQRPVAEEQVYANQVLARIRTLPEKEREAIFLVFSEGLNHREAAEIMGCRENTVSWYIHEARKKLKPLREKEVGHG